MPDALADYLCDPVRADLVLELLASVARPAWRREAACRGQDVGEWFAGTRHARATCRACCVREQCRDYAVEHGIVRGTWGGLSGRELERLRARRDESAAPVERVVHA
jgi:WhiB family redox-sensing transcriptional regulator